jgi:hypothetical protein
VNQSIKEDLMIALMWNVSVAIRRYLRMYMPTRIAIDLLRTRRGLKWAVPAALVFLLAYLYAASFVTSLIADGGPGWLNVLVLLFIWNAAKFAWMAVISVPMLLRAVLRDRSLAQV